MVDLTNCISNYIKNKLRVGGRRKREEIWGYMYS